MNVNSCFRSALIVGVLAGVFSIQSGCDTTDPRPSPQPAQLSLDPDEVFRILSPNGGETFRYGDTITVTWLQNTRYALNAMVNVWNGGSSCPYWGSNTEYVRLIYDTDTTKDMYLKPINDTTAFGTQKVIVQDKEMVGSDCLVIFSGSEMILELYDEYGERREKSDYMDGRFTVIK